MLMLCYGKMCSALWSNYKQKKEQQKETNQQLNQNHQSGRDIEVIAAPSSNEGGIPAIKIFKRRGFKEKVTSSYFFLCQD